MDRGLFRLLSVLVLCVILGVSVACAVEIDGVIYINSEPTGANIFLKVQGSPVDGLTVDDLIDVTPKQFQVVPGKYTIYLQKYGKISWWQDIEVGAGQLLNLGTIDLDSQTAMYGALHIETNPADAEIVLERIIDPRDPQKIENSLIYGKTPLSLESLPPCGVDEDGKVKPCYKYTIRKENYYPVEGTLPVEIGKVTEIVIPLQLIPTTEPVRFNSLPVGAEVYVFPFLSRYDGVELETLDFDVDEIKAEANMVIGFIGFTPTVFEMPSGKWMYVMTKDSYFPVIGAFSVTVGTPVPDINRELIPFPQFVQVYFETEQPNVIISYKGKEIGRTPETNNCSMKGVETCYGVWVPLPAEMIVDVVFSKQHFKNLTVKVDTSLFKGRPSKWGQLIDKKIGFERVRYTITSKTDEFTTILPAEPQTVIAEDCGGDYTISIRPAFNLDYEIQDITLNDSSFMDIPPDQTTWVVSKDACDTGPIVRDSVLSVTAERKSYLIEMMVGPGGSALCDDSLCDAEVMVLSGDDSPAITFVPDDGFALLIVRVNGRERFDDPLIIPEVRKDYIVEALFRPTHVTITSLCGDNGSCNITEPYLMEYGGCSEGHEFFPDTGHTVDLLIYKTDDGRPEFLTESKNPAARWRECGIIANTTVEASFFPFTFDITANAYGNGTINPSGSMTAKFMDSITFILRPDRGSSLIKLMNNGVDVTDQVTTHALDAEDEADDDFAEERIKRLRYVLANITEDHDIQAFFTGAADYLTITPYSNEGGTIVPSKPQIVKRGEDVSFTITADSCHTIGSIETKDIADSPSAEGIEGPYPSPFEKIFTNVQTSKEFIVEFVPKGYFIDVIQAEGGTIRPDGKVQVMCGEDASFTITANPGNAVYRLIIDGIEQPGNGKGEDYYRFRNVTENHTISAIFVIPPEPNFSANYCDEPGNRPVNYEDPTPICRAPPKYPVTFKDLTKNSPVALLWNFGDGTISNEREPTHLYADTGVYTVSLTAFNAAAPEGVTVVMKDFIKITTDPIAKFSAEPDGGMSPPGFTVKMTDLSLNAAASDRVSFAWDFGDGKGSSIGRNPSYTYDTPGVYKIGLKVEKPFVTADYYYHTVTVLQEPVANFSAHPISGPAPLAVQFEDKSQGFPTQWRWLFGDAGEGELRGSFDVHPRYVFSEPGVYAVTLEVASDEGSDIITKEAFITVT